LAGTEDEEVVEGLGAVVSGVGRLDRVEHHLAQDRPGRGQAKHCPSLLSGDLEVRQIEAIRLFLTEHLAQQAGFSRVILNQKTWSGFSLMSVLRQQL
jgi:hypothetical protein